MPGRPVGTDVPAVRPASVMRFWRSAMIACPAVTAGVVLAVGTQDTAAQAARAADPDLLIVLRLMAGIKATAAIGVLGASHWRLRLPASRLLAPALVGAGMLMACGPALIWTMAGVGLGVVSFYAGLVAAIVVLLTDRATVAAVLEQLAARRRGGTHEFPGQDNK